RTLEEIDQDGWEGCPEPVLREMEAVERDGSHSSVRRERREAPEIGSRQRRDNLVDVREREHVGAAVVVRNPVNERMEERVNGSRASGVRGQSGHRHRLARNLVEGQDVGEYLRVVDL